VPGQVVAQGATLGGMIEVGDKAPDFKLRDLEGNLVHLSSFLDNNKAVVLAFYLLDFSGA